MYSVFVGCFQDTMHVTHEAARILTCDWCCKAKLPKVFDSNMQAKWRNMDETAEILCKRCTGADPATGRTRQDLQKYTCCGEACSADEGQKAWPEDHYVPEHLLTTLKRSKAASAHDV